MPTDTPVSQTTAERRLTLVEWLNDPILQGIMREAAEARAQNYRMAKRVQRHRRIITRLLAERRAAKTVTA